MSSLSPQVHEKLWDPLGIHTRASPKEWALCAVAQDPGSTARPGPKGTRGADIGTMAPDFVIDTSTDGPRKNVSDYKGPTLPLAPHYISGFDPLPP